MRFQLPKIYAITNSASSGRSHSMQVSELVAAGSEFIQIREKDVSSGDLYRSAASAVKIAGGKARIIINDRVDIALSVAADGVHLGQEDLPPTEARDLLGPERIIGFSTHNVGQAIEAMDLPIDYIAAGPVFPTNTKQDPEAVIGLSGLAEIRKAIGNFPLVAIGGISAVNIRDVFSAGADSAAVISALLSKAAPTAQNYRHLEDLVTNTGKRY